MHLITNLEAGLPMTSLVNTLSRALTSIKEDYAVAQIALFCGAGLLVTLLLLIYGVDLSIGLF